MPETRRYSWRAWGALLCLLAAAPASAQILNTISANPDITANADSVVYNFAGAASFTVSVRGTFSGTVNFFVDDGRGTCTVAVPISPIGGAAAVTTSTSVGTWSIQNKGYLQFCVTGSSWSSGTATVSVVRGFGVTGDVSLDLSGSTLNASIDAPVAAPLFVRISNGSTAIDTIPVSLASVPSHAVTNAGTFLVQAAESGTWTVQPGNTANTTPWLFTGAVTNAGTFGVQVNGAALTSLQLIDDIVAGSGVNVSQINGVTPLMGNGVTGTGAPRVSIASDSTGGVRLQDGTGNALTSLSVGSQRAITVSVVDGSGNQVTAFSGSGGTASNYGSAVPSAGTAAGFSDGTNMQLARVVDLDTGAGAFYGVATNLVKRTSGTPTELIGQAAMAASLPVTLASDQSAIPVLGSKTNNNAAPGATNVGALTALANASAPSWTEGNLVALSTDLAGNLRVNAVTGVTQASTTSGQSGMLVQGATTTAAPTYTTAQTNPLSLTTTGDLRVSLASVPSHAVTNAGTFAVQSAQSGTWTVQPGNTANTTAWLVTGTGGTFPTTNAGTFAVQESGAALTALQLIDNLPLAQASTTSGQNGLLTMAAVTTSAPTYTNGQTSPLSLTPGGLLRVAVQGGNPTEVLEGSVYAAGGNVSVTGARRCDTPTPGTGVANGDVAVPCLSAFGATYTTLVASDGSVPTFGLDRTNDTGTSGTETGPYFMTRRSDTAASSATATNRYAALNTDYLGRLWLRQGDPCADYARLQSAPISTSTSGNTQLVPLNSGDIVYVCGYKTVPSADVSVNFVYGTGSACATGETALEGPNSYQAHGGGLSPNTGAVQLKTAVSNALCVKLSGAVQTGGYVNYVRTAAP